MSTASPKGKRKKSAGSVSTWEAVSRQEPASGLTLERIVATGVAIADREGLGAVSIRKVAAKLGSSAMALYHYIPSKRDLLNLMLDSTYTEFQFPAQANADWREAMSHFAWESRRSIKRHPWVTAVRTDDPEYGPECIRVLEALLASLSPFGLDVKTAIQILGALFVFVNGFVAAEGFEHRGSKKRPGGQLPVFSKAVLATGKFPNVARFVEMDAEAADQAFVRALNWMLDGIAYDLAARARASERCEAPKRDAGAG